LFSDYLNVCCTVAALKNELYCHEATHLTCDLRRNWWLYLC